MQLICPVCNGMQPLEAPCPKCRHTMNDMGASKDYFGPYSPYEEIASPALSGRLKIDTDKCSHLLECPKCFQRSCKLVNRIII